MISVIQNGTIFTGDETLKSHAVIIEDEIIKDIVHSNDIPSNINYKVDLAGGYLAPGFIDLQVNGGGGVMFNSAPTVDTLKQIMQGHRQFGTTGLMPTLITESYETMLLAVAAVEQALAENVPGILGIHLEGPFLSSAKKGAHDANKFCRIDEQGIDIVTSLKRGNTIITIAPELTSNKTIKALNDAGIIICAGHSNADFEQTTAAIQAGLHGFTHLYNAMTPLQSRSPGMVGAAISDDTTWFGIIADGYHMHPSAFKIAVTAKRKGGAILVTDAMATVGSTQNSFELDGESIKAENGKCVNAAGSLAGSDLNMNQAVINAMKFANISWQEAMRMASVYPAHALGVDSRLGYIKPGYQASLVSLDTDFKVTKTWIDGQDAN